MTIGFDGKRAVFNATGLGNYSRLVVDVLSEFYPHEHYILYSPKAQDNPELTSLLCRPDVHLKLPYKANLGGAYWRSVSGMMGDAHRHHVRLFHGLSGELPLDIAKSGIPSVLTVHDLIFKRFPQYYKPIDRMIYNFKFRRACRDATRIIAISECTKREIMHFYGVPAEKIDVVYQGCNEIFRKPVDDDEINDVRARYRLPSRFILSVGTIEERKNALLAVKALEHIDDQEIRLVLVGHHTKYYKEIMRYASKHGLGRRIFSSRVRTEHLPAVYHMAEAFVYPSRFEGFGIPILEALCCGTPVIAATGSCLEEAGGEACIYVNPDSVEEMTLAINRVLTDSDLRKRMTEQGHAHSERFDRHKMADALMAVYRKAIEAAK